MRKWVCMSTLVNKHVHMAIVMIRIMAVTIFNIISVLLPLLCRM